VFGLDAAAATTGDHPDHAIKDGDEEQSRDEAQHQNVHSGHSGSVHGSYEASTLLLPFRAINSFLVDSTSFPVVRNKSSSIWKLPVCSLHTP
jgi:hypothetical protein